MIYVTFNDGVEYLVDSATGRRTPVSQVNGGDWDDDLVNVGPNQFFQRGDSAIEEQGFTVTEQLPSNVVPFTPAPEVSGGGPAVAVVVAEPPPLFMPTPDEDAGNNQGWFDYPDPEPAPGIDPGGITEPYLGDLDIGSEVDPYREPYLGDLDIGSEPEPPSRPWYEDHYGMGGFQTPPPVVDEDEDGGFSIFGWTPPSLSIDWDNVSIDPLAPFGGVNPYDTTPSVGDVVDLVDVVTHPSDALGAPLTSWWEENKWLVIGGAIGLLVLVIALR